MTRIWIVEIEDNDWVTADDIQSGIQREIAEYARDYGLRRGAVTVEPVTGDEPVTDD